MGKNGFQQRKNKLQVMEREFMVGRANCWTCKGVRARLNDANPVALCSELGKRPQAS